MEKQGTFERQKEIPVSMVSDAAYEQAYRKPQAPPGVAAVKSERHRKLEGSSSISISSEISVGPVQELSSTTAEQEAVHTQMQDEDIAAHLSMVRFLARRIHERLPSHVELDELIGAGVLGLMDAFKKFDPEKKVKFRSYAQFRVRGAILDSLRTLDWSPRDLRRKAREIETAIQALTGKFGRSPSEFEVATELKMSLVDYQHVLGDLKSLEVGTLNVERSEDSGEEELAYIPNRKEDDPLFQCLRGEMHARLKEAIESLPERERLVMNLYYFEELTMKEIGSVLGVVESRISQVHASAVLHLRASLHAFRTINATDKTAVKRISALNRL